jgi:hypothetical protein
LKKNSKTRIVNILINNPLLPPIQNKPYIIQKKTTGLKKDGDIEYIKNDKTDNWPPITRWFKVAKYDPSETFSRFK